MKYNTGIYQIINKINGKKYIGSSINLRSRKSQHFNKLKNNSHGTKHLQYSYNKYGKESFEFQVLLYCSNENLLFYEQRAIDLCDKNKSYNKRIIAENNFGIKLSEEHKMKIRNAGIGRKHSEESKIKMSIASQNMSEWHRKRISETHKGKKISDEIKKKLRDCNLGKRQNEETKLKMSRSSKNKKPIIAYLLKNNKFVGEFESIEFCCKKLKLHHKGVRQVLHGMCDHSGGYFFKYANEDNTKYEKIREYRKLFSGKFRQIKMIELKNINNIKIFKSINDCISYSGIPRIFITDILRGRSKSKKGYTFEYVNKKDKNKRIKTL